MARCHVVSDVEAQKMKSEVKKLLHGPQYAKNPGQNLSTLPLAILQGELAMLCNCHITI